MKEKIPWGSIIGFLLLLALGIGIPFWLEYQSLTNPPPVPVAEKTERRESIDARKGYYCPNCGGNITLPERGEASKHGDAPSTSLALKRLERPPWEPLKLSTQTAIPKMELHENP